MLLQYQIQHLASKITQTLLASFDVQSKLEYNEEANRDEIAKIVEKEIADYVKYNLDSDIDNR